MWIKEPGKITDRIDFLGTKKICLYLLKGEQAMIVGGGMSWVVPYLEKQFSTLNFDLNKIRYLVIPHSHFDHCGAVPYLKSKFPHIQILASAYSQEVFSKEKAMDFIASVNKRAEERYLQKEHLGPNLPFERIQVDRIVRENDVINLGDGIEAHFIEVPGHTRCSIATYIPQLKAIFPSDSAPFPTDDGSELANPSAQYDFSLYLESLRKLASYEAEVCGFDHHGAFVRDQAQKILQQGLEQAQKFPKRIIEEYHRIGDLDKITEELVAEAAEKNKFDFLGLELEKTVVRTVIEKCLATTPT
ncbi:MAG: hypothetical protein CO103_08135 [Chloroflexi bacterium CG_4_9_14_3_um_filter_45_9]|nr:MAG: hypothetical protein CO103_08135 [Chloroflexi bacterium CG_4_9_14_3_um_filter_45_9]